MNYTKLDATQQAALLEQRIAQYEAEHFAHSVNKDLLVANGEQSQEVTQAIAVAEQAMETLDKAHAEVTKKLAAVKPAPPAKPPTPPPNVS